MRIECRQNGSVTKIDQDKSIVLTDNSTYLVPRNGEKPLQLTTLYGLKWEYVEGSNDRWRIRVCYGEESSLHQISLFGDLHNPDQISAITVCYPVKPREGSSNSIHHLELTYTQPCENELFPGRLELTKIVKHTNRTFFDGKIICNSTSTWEKYSPESLLEEHDQLLSQISERLGKGPEEFDVINGAQLSLYYSDFFTLCDLDIERFTTDPLDPTLVS